MPTAAPQKKRPQISNVSDAEESNACMNEVVTMGSVGMGSNKALLKEYFLNAYLIALLKQAGEQTARLREVARKQLPATFQA